MKKILSFFVSMIVFISFVGFFNVSANAQEKQIVASKNSNKFHYSTCRWAQRITAKNKIEFKSADEARSAGYLPCGTCKPETSKEVKSEQSVSGNKNQSTQASDDGRCQAKTKKGTQCKRKAQAASKYCWQHNR